MIMKMIFFVLLSLFLYHAHAFQQTSSDGDIVECMDKYKQRALLYNPLLTDHKIQESPYEIPTGIKTNKKSEWPTFEAHVSTADCPEGTIPVLQYWSDLSGPGIGNQKPKHQYAEVATGIPQKIYGTRTTINLWDPIVENPKLEFSLAQFWISSGSYESNDLNTIEVGWQVYPMLYNDTKPRLFIFWTRDTYKNTGGYNLIEPAFVQTSSRIVIGGSISPVSTFAGRQYEITTMVWKDRKSGNWWLSLGPQNSLVGYWPHEIFGSLTDHANKLEWGGEITDSHSSNRHTKTQMGSGYLPKEGFRKASYFRNLETVNNNNTLEPVQKLEAMETDTFYKVERMDTDDWGTHFFYGGSGLNYKHSGVFSLRLNLYFICLSFSVFIII